MDVCPLEYDFKTEVQCPIFYVTCDGDAEDLAHVFFHCPFAVQVWHLVGTTSLLVSKHYLCGGSHFCLDS